MPNAAILPDRLNSFGQLPPVTTTTTSYVSYEMIQYHLPNGSSAPWSITSDNLGRIWFVQQSPPELVRFNDGQNDSFFQYPIPADGNQEATPEYVTADLSGNIWFSDLTGSKLGELKNGSSTVSEFPIPSSYVKFANTQEPLNCGPTILKIDASGNVWIACAFSNQIDEFFPRNSSFLAFDLPVWMSAPAGFAFDKKGNLWFTAADADMIGQAVISQLRNGTSNGITETPPSNSTYKFTISHESGVNGPLQNITSSLRTPAGITLSPDGNTLWITEHVDSSFDSYNIASRTLVRYWTSQTFNAYGYSVSFPNAIAIDSNGIVWFGEHYGNKIAEFDPATDSLIEYSIPCCTSDAAGPYSIALGPNQTVWFVEITGAAIGELKPVSQSQPFSISLSNQSISMGSSSTENIPVALKSNGDFANANMSISGISATGALTNASANFSNPIVHFPSGNNIANDNLTLRTLGLAPGGYCLTVSASLPNGAIYSSILRLNVISGPQNLSLTSVYVVIIAVALSAGVIGILTIVSRRPRRRRMISRRR